MSYTVEGTWRLLKRHSWSWQQPARRAIERDDAAVELWKKEVWPRVGVPRRRATAGSSLRTSWPVDDAAARQDLGLQGLHASRSSARPGLGPSLDGGHVLLQTRRALPLDLRRP
ncbi:winged helix-turn-helix domain-containing protein [Streptomyces sp. NBC_00564]|uniref:helix-turn-helix domain-containing protein n=1 Tax=Streptomyces sp. NBC_00564 TaxID=2903663 RepID=UPI00352F8C0E